MFLFLGFVPDMGRPAGEGDDALVRIHDSRRGGREVQRLSVLGVHEPDPGPNRVRAVVPDVQAASPRSAHVQVLLRLAL